MPHRMKAPFWGMLALCAVLPATAFGQGFIPYPGATADQAAADAATKAAGNGSRVGVYVTPDPFEKVAAFYRARYKETTMPASPLTLPNGDKVKWAFFTMDGAKDLATSKAWVKVQRPYIGNVVMQGTTPQFTDIRDVTVIQTVEKP